MAKINKAFILAAGRGTRMLHLTDEKPKPLVEVSGKTLIDYNIDRLVADGIKECVVNLCYKGDMIKEHLSQRNDINFLFSEEDEALETGGGVKKALPFIGKDAFLVLNSDPMWTEVGSETILSKIIKAWDDDKYDILLMLQPLANAYDDATNGDYLFDENGVLKRNVGKALPAPYIYGGMLIIHPRIFKDSPDGKFSLVKLFDKAEQEKRLGSVIHEGKWFHVGSPQAREVAESFFNN